MVNAGLSTRSGRLCAGIAGAGVLPWMLFHVALHVVLLAAGSIGAQLPDTFRTVGDNVVLGLFGAYVVSYVLVPLTVVLLALLRLGKELRWYWFRVVALVLFNLPDLLFLGAGTPWIFPIVNSALALLVIQPRWRL
ncbi:hypothetical protein [Paractinoplanes atraurantiacus]|uniref:Uncharacterized protein n=1 Tax=Paractinoplanes atraurantiacus TaxID=1036182 RepID=A0A285J4D2_9ACTN|nr:hypothetical protein [Actinoplanes atraurantiacus]SNY55200.1 hypothetical protein SAMN05421748_11672 [Actinoplanes atraurantiacus]